MELISGKIRLGAIALALSSVATTSAVAGVVDARKTVDSTTVFLGVVPAAITRTHPSDHIERQMHGGAPDRSIHNIHVLVAVFDGNTGARVTNARVSARLAGDRGRGWSLPLKPMTVNGAVTYGGYTSMGVDMNARIYVDVVRTIAGRSRRVSARFEYTHD